MSTSTLAYIDANGNVVIVSNDHPLPVIIK